MTAIIRAEGVSKNFLNADGHTFQVLSDVGVSIEAGEIVCLLGASGSGKTTLLNILAGFEDAATSSVFASFPRPGAAVGYLVQSDTLLPWRSIEKNVALGPELLGVAVPEALLRARTLLDAVGLCDFKTSYPSQLSGGMRQRALLARVFATQPSLLLLDEPMSNLDILARRSLADIIKTYVRTHNAGALIVSHSVEEACFLANRILILTRSPARIFKEIIVPDDGGESSLSAVAAALMAALEATHV